MQTDRIMKGFVYEKKLSSLLHSYFGHFPARRATVLSKLRKLDLPPSSDEQGKEQNLLSLASLQFKMFLAFLSVTMLESVLQVQQINKSINAQI